MGITLPQIDDPRGLAPRGGSDLWDTPQASVVLAADYFTVATGGPTYLNVGKATFSAARPAQRFALRTPIGVSAVQGVRPPPSFKLGLGCATRVVNMTRAGITYKLTYPVASRGVVAVPLSVLLREVPPPVILSIATQLFGVQGAPMVLGNAMPSGLVIPYAILEHWLAQHQERVVTSAGPLHVLQSGQVIFVVG
jgi:hypothetical protein